MRILDKSGSVPVVMDLPVVDIPRRCGWAVLSDSSVIWMALRIDGQWRRGPRSVARHDQTIVMAPLDIYGPAVLEGMALIIDEVPVGEWEGRVEAGEDLLEWNVVWSFCSEVMWYKRV